MKWHEGFQHSAGRGALDVDCKEAGRKLAARFNKQLTAYWGKGGRNLTLKAALDLGAADEWLGLKYYELTDEGRTRCIFHA